MKDLEKVINDLRGQLADLTSAIVTIKDLQDIHGEAITGLQGVTTQLDELTSSHAELIDEVRGTVNGFEVGEEGVPEDETDDQRATRIGLQNRVAEVEALVKGRNRSAPVKRNMTDADAVECLTGKAKDLDHKDAGEVLGLTYAQVYSCRLEYTFKHVHKDLRDSGWKNPWAKK